ncbi:ammonium transporter [Endomicrobium proavitum]|uniref:Ammonium transporter n=1 Tax=Endomicrobium proavitum TaxID=1408281 RepID=A0A0G3WG46_9BACT|nr:ammonium transporter [Endomicrobium proavitum]AKL97601.1 ammonium transporter [Endomicrobium proavitum]
MEPATFSSVDTLWVLFGAALVFFMQPGFAMLEAGLTRAKNAGNIVLKNLMDFAFGSLCYWAIGFGIMFGAGTAFVGVLDFFVHGNYAQTFPTPAFLIFQTVFCATAATIVSGAMAERTKFTSYVIYSIVISAIVYPISGHWIWGGGFLAEMGFHDFAGSTTVHMVGGVAAFIGAALLGSRIGKYSKKGESQAIPGHSITLAALGVFILWFGWFGFNGASTVSMTGESIVSAASIFVTTNLAAAAAAAATLLLTWVRYKKPDVSMTLNGVLAGLVAITAGCDAVSPEGAVLIGLIAGVVVVFAVEFIDKVLKVDDPVGAVAVHGVCGALGTVLTGIFALDGGLLYGGGLKMLSVQAFGVIVVAAWISVTMFITFFLLKKTIGLRVDKEEEVAGLDITEHGMIGYADFMPSIFASALEDEAGKDKLTPVPPVPHSALHSGIKLTKVVVVINQNKFEQLKSALDNLGITGITVTQVLGRGMQRGHQEYYRGSLVETALLPKVKVEIVVAKIPVDALVNTIKQALHTGNIGDGKIFVYDVENVIKVRTSEEGYDALQDEQDVK